jgi:NADPH:quinone reductase-like Zn-dependent oxidoreductase
VLIHGAAGGVGHFAVQFAKARGAVVYATASGDHVARVRELGANEVIDYKVRRFEDVARDIDLVFDLIGGEIQERSWAVLKPGGIVVSTVAAPSQEKAASHRARGTIFRAQPNGRQLAEIGALIDAGKVKPMVQAVFALSEAAKALQANQQGHTLGKIVLRVV